MRLRQYVLAAFMASVIPPFALADDALWVEVTPKYCRDPCRLDVAIRLDPHESDRALIVEADNGTYYRSSTLQLDGGAEASLHRVVFKWLPAGEYLVRVSLGRVDGLAATSDHEVLVLGS